MDVYLDLSLLFLLIEIMVCIYGVELLMTYRYKRGMKITLVLVNLILFFTIYLPFWVCITLFFILNISVFIVFNKKWIYDFCVFIILFFMINFLISLLTSKLKMLHIYLIISSAEGIFYCLLIPLFGLMLVVSSKLVDSLFHLHVYKTTCVLTKEDKKFAFKAFYDSGNTLKYDNVPVVFCVKKLWNFSLESPVEIEANGINGSKKYQGYEALLSFGEKDENFFVYVVLLDDVNSFHGCEMLLNAYLR